MRQLLRVTRSPQPARAAMTSSPGRFAPWSRSPATRALEPDPGREAMILLIFLVGSLLGILVGGAVRRVPAQRNLSRHRAAAAPHAATARQPGGSRQPRNDDAIRRPQHWRSSYARPARASDRHALIKDPNQPRTYHTLWASRRATSLVALDHTSRSPRTPSAMETAARPGRRENSPI